MIKSYKRSRGVVYCIVGGILLVGCAAVPMIITPMGLAQTSVDIVSYASTEKSIIDHMISAVMDEDCALYRITTDDDICKPTTEQKLKQLADDQEGDDLPVYQ